MGAGRRSVSFCGTIVSNSYEQDFSSGGGP